MSERERDGRWLVVVFGPAPRPDEGTTYSLASDTRKVVWKVARTAAAAAEGCGVPPGGHALVVAAADVRRFDRAVTAPLVEGVEPEEPGAPRWKLAGREVEATLTLPGRTEEPGEPFGGEA